MAEKQTGVVFRGRHPQPLPDSRPVPVQRRPEAASDDATTTASAEANAMGWKPASAKPTNIPNVGTPIPPAVVRYIAAVAGRAPSVHNTQPWAFTYTDNGAIELHTDATRQLPVADSSGRELHISCGAALFGLRLAVRNLGYRPLVALQPHSVDPSLLARLTYGVPAPPSNVEQNLLRAMSVRHTHRGALAADPVPATLLAALQRVTEREGARLVFLHVLADRERLAELVVAAERSSHRNPELRRELLAWTPPPDSLAREGVPATAYPSTHTRPERGELIGRDFALNRPWGQHTTATPHGASLIAVLTTTADDRAAWLSAGQALHHLLLTAAQHGVFANLHTQPLELPHLREAVHRQYPVSGHVQMLLSLGTGDATGLTPRRPVSDTLVTSGSSQSAKVWLS